MSDKKKYVKYVSLESAMSATIPPVYLGPVTQCVSGSTTTPFLNVLVSAV